MINPCDYCPSGECWDCPFDDPCLKCKDYDKEQDKCLLDGWCAKLGGEQE